MSVVIRGIGCDFGNVNGDFDHELAIAALATFSDFAADEIRARIFHTSLEEDFDCGRLSTSKFLSELRQLLRISNQTSDRQLTAAWRDIFRRSAENERVLRIVRSISRDTRLVLASNTNELHFEAIAAGWSDLIAWMDDVVLSCRAGARKPSPQFYATVLDKLGTPPAESLFIDDRPDFVAAASEAGMLGLQYVPGLDLAAVLADYHVRLDDDRGLG